MSTAVRWRGLGRMNFGPLLVDLEFGERKGQFNFTSYFLFEHLCIQYTLMITTSMLDACYCSDTGSGNMRQPSQ